MMLWSKDFCRDKCCNVYLQVVTSKLCAGGGQLLRETVLLRTARLISWLSEQAGHEQWNVCPAFSEQVSVGFPSACVLIQWDSFEFPIPA